MVSGTLLAMAALFYAIAGVFAFVGLRLLGREVGPSARFAVLQFAVWWLAVGGSTAVTATQDLLGAVGFTDAAVFATLADLNLLFVAVALQGLLFYLLYLYTGRRFLGPVVVLFTAVFALLLYNNRARQPVGVELRLWDTALAWAVPEGGLPRLLLLAILLLPPIVGALGMLLLARRAQEPTSRFRALLVGGSILVWFGGAFLSAAASLDAHPLWGVVVRVAGLGAAVAALAAYFPPAWLRRRYGVRSLAEQEPRPQPAVRGS